MDTNNMSHAHTHRNTDTNKATSHTPHSPTNCHNLVPIGSKTEHSYRTLLVGQQTNILKRVAMETVHPATVGAKSNILPRGSDACILQVRYEQKDPFLHIIAHL